MRAGKGEDECVPFHFEDQPQIQPDAHLEVILHQLPQPQSRVPMRLAQRRL